MSNPEKDKRPDKQDYIEIELDFVREKQPDFEADPLEKIGKWLNKRFRFLEESIRQSILDGIKKIRGEDS